MNRFKQSLAFYILYYFLSIFTHWNFLFVNQKMTSSELWTYIPPLYSPNLFARPLFVYLLLTAVVLLAFRLLINKAHYFELCLLTVAHLLLLHANPLIVHEPQPLTQIFLWVLVLLGPKSKNEEWVKFSLIAFLGVYYFVSGIKKIPLDIWLQGGAINNIMTWPGTARHLGLNEFLVNKAPWLGVLATYLTLVFELSFIVGIWTRLRPLYIYLGLFFHFFIGILLDVGSFSVLMLAWYSVFLTSPKVRYGE